MMRYVLMAAASVGLAGHAGGASAHAFLKAASPAVGSVLHSAPTEVEITFTEEIEPSFSTIQVTDASGARVDRGAPHAEGDGTRLAVGLQQLADGVYTIAWHALSIDTHKTEGTFTFTLKP